MDIEEGPIWAVLRAKAPDRAPAVKSLAEEAAAKLKLVRDTFPTYTLHDEVHAANVLRLMGDLLDERAADLTGLEAAMLILAAYHHDIGMVYTPAELARVRDDPAFEKYLSTHHEDYLAVRAAGGEPPPDVLERYCRSRHADRVFDHLSGIADRLRWGNVSIFKHLGEVCRSHNLDVSDLKSDRFDPHFLAQCDLRLCALLLRLADILDLDDTRAPRAIYDHLRLADRHTARAAVSDAEWSKHLRADGFVFPRGPRPQNYPLPFIAGPEHPAVEHDIRAFLDVVDDELRRCRPVLDTCAPGWRALPLPGEVDRRHIIGEGYTYGAFRFELDRASVLHLFTGERLYDDPYVFVRELLQNAIDAVRLRGALDLDPPTGAPGVAVTAWEDAGGFLWVRIDDDGVGMDERTLREFFLRVGRSYYNSAELRADLARHGRPDGDFLAISRFGIGVLSCFIAGDLIELSTRRQLPDGTLGEPLRLSLARDEEFFVLRHWPDPPTPMPRAARDGEGEGYREAPGTSIAVRVNPTKVDVTKKDLAARVDGYVRCPPMPVTFNGRPAGSPPIDVLDKPLLDGPRSLTLPERAEDDIYLGPIEVGLLPFDLTAASPTPKLRGQLLAIGARVPPARDGKPSTDLLVGWPEEELAVIPPHIRELCATAVRSTWVSAGVRPNDVAVTVWRRVPEHIASSIRAGMVPIHGGAPRLEALLRRLRSLRRDPGAAEGGDIAFHVTVALPDLAWVAVDTRPVREPMLSPVRWAHNGIATPAGSFGSWPNEIISDDDSLVVGQVALSDRLRPELTIGRDHVRALPIGVVSAVSLAQRRAAAVHFGGQLGWLAKRMTHLSLFQAAPLAESPLGTVMDDPLVAAGEWDREALWSCAGEPVSAEAIRARHPALPDDLSDDLNRSPWHGRAAARAGLVRTVVQMGLDVVCTPPAAGTEAPGTLRVRSGRRPDPPAGLRHFPPLSFVPYETTERLLLRHVDQFDNATPLNLVNPFAKWLVGNADALAAHLPVLFNRLRRELSPWPEPRGAARLNTWLEQVAQARPGLAPPPEAYLREDSPEGEWWTR